MLTKLNVVLIL